MITGPVPDSIGVDPTGARVVEVYPRRSGLVDGQAAGLGEVALGGRRGTRQAGVGRAGGRRLPLRLVDAGGDRDDREDVVDGAGAGKLGLDRGGDTRDAEAPNPRLLCPLGVAGSHATEDHRPGADGHDGGRLGRLRIGIGQGSGLIMGVEPDDQVWMASRVLWTPPESVGVEGSKPVGGGPNETN